MSAPESEFPRVWEWVRASASGRRSAPEPGRGRRSVGGRRGAWSEQAESVSVAARAARYRSFAFFVFSSGFPGSSLGALGLIECAGSMRHVGSYISDCFRPLRGPLPARRRRRYPGWSAFSAPLGPVTVLDIRAASTLRSGATARPIARSPPPLPPSAFHARDGLHRDCPDQTDSSNHGTLWMARTIKWQPEGVNCIRFTQLTHSHRVTTPLTSVKVYNCLPLPKRLPRGGLFTPDDPITVRNTCALKAG